MDYAQLLDVDFWITGAVEYGPKVLAALVVWIAFWLLYNITHVPLKKILRRADFDPNLTRILVDNTYKAALYILGLVMAVSQLGVNVTAALAGIGVVGIAVGFAAQDTLSNIIAGFLIFWDKPFQVGDWISVKNEYGRVTEITMRSTRIRTVQNTYVVIPNKIIADEVVNNHSKHGETRVDVIIGIAYKENIPEARKVLLNAVKDIDGVANEPPPEVVVKEIADSSINLMVKMWIDDAKDEQGVFYAGNEACKLALDQAGIEIPFPHLQLFVDDVKKTVIEKVTAAVK